MKQLTLRGFDKDLLRRLEETAQRKGVSLNKAALELMRKGAGLATADSAANTVGGALDEFIGSWSDERASELREAIRPLEAIDEDFWR